MPYRKSFTVRVFGILLIIFLVLLMVGDYGIYAFARQSVGQEFIRLNQASLSQLAASTGQALKDAVQFGEKVSGNSRILQLSSLSDGEGEKEVHSLLSDMTNEYNTTRTGGSNLLEVYVLGNKGLSASAYNSSRYTWTELQEDPRCESLFQGQTDMVMFPTTRNIRGKGIMNYSFQILFMMRDLLSGEIRGIVVLDLSELVLYDQYRDYQDKNVSVSIIGTGGMIISDKNKKKIGTNYNYDGAALEELAASSRIDRRIVDGQFILYERVPGSSWLLVEQIPASIAFASLAKVRNAVMMTILICSLLAVAALILTAKSMLLRVMRIRNKMAKVIQGDLAVRIPRYRDDEFGQIESDFNSMVEEINRLIEKVRQSEQQKRAAEMDFLHAQINSHFIHNTLTSIRFMLEMGKTQEAGEMIFYFSKLLRQTLSRSNEFIPLHEEIDTLKSYVELQKYRYQNAFEAVYDILPETEDAQVPALILQPIVENAIFYGVGREFRHIEIAARREGADLILTVSDDGSGMSEELCQTVLHKEVPLNHVGIRNVHERIQMNYGSAYGLSIESKEGQGTRVTYTLPFNTANDTKGDAENGS